MSKRNYHKSNQNTPNPVFNASGEEVNVWALIAPFLDDIRALLKHKTDNYIINLKQERFPAGENLLSGSRLKAAKIQINKNTILDFAEYLSNGDSYGRGIVSFALGGKKNISFIAASYVMKNSREVFEMLEAFTDINSKEFFRYELTEALKKVASKFGFEKTLAQEYDREKIISLLLKNSKYKKMLKTVIKQREEQERLKRGLLNAIPETYPELFPLAREMERHFVLHVGPTNSGKSYEAVNELKQCEHGVYLAPLRLLAFEKYEEFTEAGVPCSMITGEESIITENARIQSSTIEILDYTEEFDIAVIDEGQMLADSQRGSAWTMAILGLRAPLIHICLAPEALEVIKTIITDCNDTYEIKSHERLVPLTLKRFDHQIFPKNSMRGDAFIVFSRKDVHAVAADLSDNGVNCSMVYGNLPYDVRRQEIKRYLSGETDVVVATDAIGMGLNLPIKRIVFLSLEKFDGIEKRPLTASEIKQIAGRAGRFGMFDEGIVCADVDKRFFEETFNEEIVPIENATIGFPKSLISVPGKLSYLLNEWAGIKPLPGFEMADLSEEIKLALELEKYTDDKDLVYKFVMIPFDSSNPILFELWLQLFGYALNEKEADIISMLPDFEFSPLDVLETNFKECDLLYHYAKDFAGANEEMEIMHVKNLISVKIMEILSEQEPERKKCKYCGRSLPFRYRYGICEKCFERRRWH